MSPAQALIDTLGNVFSSLRDTIARCLPTAKERRRHALLQVSALILVHGDSFSAGQGLTVPMAVDSAVALLSEIERREKVEAQS